MIRLSPISRPSDLPVLKPLAELKPEPASPPGGPAELPLARGRERSAGPGPGARIVRAVRAFPAHSGRGAFPRTRLRPPCGSRASPSRGARGRRRAMLFALAALTLAVPLTAQAQNATGAPGITGTARVGETLTATKGTIADPDGLHTTWFSNAATTVQWIRVDGGSDSEISSATDRTYTLVAADEGKQVKVKVDFTDDDVNDESRTSDAYPAGSTVAADTTPPTLTSAVIGGTGNFIDLQFSENVDRSNLPPATAFTVTVGGSAVTVSEVTSPPGAGQDSFFLTVSPVILQGQAVVVAYADPTASDDANAIQDTAGNDAAAFTTGMNGVPAITNASTVVPATTATEVPADWSLKPTAVTAGTQFRLLFLSSTKRTGNAGNIASYNTFVQNRAAAGHADIRDYSAGFRAVGCTGAVDARDNTSTTGTGVPIYWLNGAKAADDYADFYDGSWDDEANDKNESGTNGLDTSQSGNAPWTGCTHNGTEDFDNGNSRALGHSIARVGRPNSSATGDGPLVGGNPSFTSASRPLYGLSAVFQVAADTTPPTLTSAEVDVLEGRGVDLEFSENLQRSNPPPASAFTVTVDGSAVTVSSVGVPGSLVPQNQLFLRFRLSSSPRARPWSSATPTPRPATTPAPSRTPPATTPSPSPPAPTASPPSPTPPPWCPPPPRSPRTGASSPPA